MKRKAVWVEWIDSGESTAGWSANSEPAGKDPCITIGWVAREDKEHLTVCTTLEGDDHLGRVDIWKKSIKRRCEMVIVDEVEE